MDSPLRLTLAGIQIRGMTRRHPPRHPLFRQRWFADDTIAASFVVTHGVFRRLVGNGTGD